MIRLTNAERAQAGCAPLTANSRLAQAATGHSLDMRDHNFFAHDSSDGRDMSDRADAVGYQWSALGENIAAGQTSPSQVVTSWMNSPGHRANILNCDFTQIGIGYVTGGSYGTYWTQDFGTPR